MRCVDAKEFTSKDTVYFIVDSINLKYFHYFWNGLCSKFLANSC